MKNKTFLSITVFAISLLIIPQMTFASWWKPNTWKIFNRKSEVKIEQKIIATSTPNNAISQTEKSTTTPTVSWSSDQSVGAEKIEQKNEEIRKPKAASSFADTSTQKNDQSKEIEKLKKEVEALKQKQSQFKIIEKTTEKPIIAEKKQSSSSQTKQNEKIVTLPNGAVVEMDANGNILRTIKDSSNTIIAKQSQQPRLILFQDNLDNVYTENKDFVRIASEPFNHGFSDSYTPRCLQVSDTTYDCHSEIIKWVNNHSVEIGKTLNITLNSFDANGDSVFYYVSYGSRKDWSYGTMRILQSWGTDNIFSIPITEQLYNESSFDNLGWSSIFFEPSTRKYYEKNVKLNNAGELNINICFNEKPEQMEHGEQFPYGCMLFKYFILKPEYSKMTTSMQTN